jgi:uncharacterized membrane protein
MRLAFSFSRKTTVLIVSVLIFFVLGALAAVVNEAGAATAAQNRLDVVDRIAMTVAPVFLLATWCQEDAKSRGSRFGKGMLWLLVLLWPVGWLVYLFRSRKAAGAVWTLVLFGLFVVVLLAAGGTGYLALFLIRDGAVPA